MKREKLKDVTKKKSEMERREGRKKKWKVVR